MNDDKTNKYVITIAISMGNISILFIIQQIFWHIYDKSVENISHIFQYLVQISVFLTNIHLKQMKFIYSEISIIILKFLKINRLGEIQTRTCSTTIWKNCPYI